MWIMVCLYGRVGNLHSTLRLKKVITFEHACSESSRNSMEEGWWTTLFLVLNETWYLEIQPMVLKWIRYRKFTQHLTGKNHLPDRSKQEVKRVKLAINIRKNIWRLYFIHFGKRTNIVVVRWGNKSFSFSFPQANESQKHIKFRWNIGSFVFLNGRDTRYIDAP